eukprot:m.44818 g.44818  ORF g.44818 m.44818 type:complete len:1335 (-) comp10853_c0_seq1:185-4189(-)
MASVGDDNDQGITELLDMAPGDHADEVDLAEMQLEQDDEVDLEDIPDGPAKGSRTSALRKASAGAASQEMASKAAPRKASNGESGSAAARRYADDTESQPQQKRAKGDAAQMDEVDEKVTALVTQMREKPSTVRGSEVEQWYQKAIDCQSTVALKMLLAAARETQRKVPAPILRRLVDTPFADAEEGVLVAWDALDMLHVDSTENNQQAVLDLALRTSNTTTLRNVMAYLTTLYPRGTQVPAFAAVSDALLSMVEATVESEDSNAPLDIWMMVSASKQARAQLSYDQKLAALKLGLTLPVKPLDINKLLVELVNGCGDALGEPLLNLVPESLKALASNGHLLIEALACLSSKGMPLADVDVTLVQQSLNVSQKNIEKFKEFTCMALGHVLEHDPTTLEQNALVALIKANPDALEVIVQKATASDPDAPGSLASLSFLDTITRASNFIVHPVEDILVKIAIAGVQDSDKNLLETITKRIADHMRHAPSDERPQRCTVLSAFVTGPDSPFSVALTCQILASLVTLLDEPEVEKVVDWMRQVPADDGAAVDTTLDEDNDEVQGQATGSDYADEEDANMEGQKEEEGDGEASAAQDTATTADANADVLDVDDTLDVIDAIGGDNDGNGEDDDDDDDERRGSSGRRRTQAEKSAAASDAAPAAPAAAAPAKSEQKRPKRPSTVISQQQKLLAALFRCKTAFTLSVVDEALQCQLPGFPPNLSLFRMRMEARDAPAVVYKWLKDCEPVATEFKAACKYLQAQVKASRKKRPSATSVCFGQPACINCKFAHAPESFFFHFALMNSTEERAVVFQDTITFGFPQFYRFVNSMCDELLSHGNDLLIADTVEVICTITKQQSWKSISELIKPESAARMFNACLAASRTETAIRFYIWANNGLSLSEVSAESVPRIIRACLDDVQRHPLAVSLACTHDVEPDLFDAILQVAVESSPAHSAKLLTQQIQKMPEAVSQDVLAQVLAKAPIAHAKELAMAALEKKFQVDQQRVRQIARSAFQRNKDDALRLFEVGLEHGTYVGPSKNVTGHLDLSDFEAADLGIASWYYLTQFRTRGRAPPPEVLIENGDPTELAIAIRECNGSLRPVVSDTGVRIKQENLCEALRIPVPVRHERDRTPPRRGRQPREWDRRDRDRGRDRSFDDSFRRGSPPPQAPRAPPPSTARYDDMPPRGRPARREDRYPLSTEPRGYPGDRGFARPPSPQGRVHQQWSNPVTHAQQPPPPPPVRGSYHSHADYPPPPPPQAPRRVEPSKEDARDVIQRVLDRYYHEGRFTNSNAFKGLSIHFRDRALEEARRTGLDLLEIVQDMAHDYFQRHDKCDMPYRRQGK